MRQALWSFLLIAAFCQTALAASEADWKACTEARRDVEVRIAACTRVLEDKGVTGLDLARAHFNRGVAEFSRARYAAAQGDFDRAIELEPLSASHHFWRGRARIALRQWDGAIRDNDIAIALQPRWASAFSNRGFSRANKGEYDAAIADYDKALELEPDRMLTVNNKGRALELKGRIAEAVTHYERVLASTPRPGDEDDERARQFSTQHLKDLRARLQSTSAAAGKPTAATAADRGNCERGRGDEGLAACSRVLSDPSASSTDRIAALYSRGALFSSLRQYESALADLEQILKLDAKQAEAYNRRGFILRKHLNRAREAVALFDLAIATDPSRAHFYNDRGDAHLTLGALDKALADYSEAGRRAPGYLWPMRNRAYTFERMGMFAEAEAGYAEVVRAAGRPGNSGDADAKREVEADLKRVAAIKDARTRSELPVVKRTALIIANTRYKGTFDPLTTPVNDARIIAAALKRLGFADADIVERHDLDRKGMIATLREFEGKARSSDWALVFFAGHGVRARSNLDYMIPVDAQIESERDLADEAVALERVMERISDAKKLQLIVFDACRSNELTRRLYASSDAQRSGGAGAGAPSNAPFEAPGLMLAFSARRGQAALDGRANSPFVEALLANLEKPGVDLERALSATAEDVRKATRDQQTPEIYGLGYGKGVILKR